MAFALSLAAAPAAWADDPPVIEHQPVACGVPGRALHLCASVSDDVQVARARVFFRADEGKYWSVVDMVFGGLQYCATLPAVRPGHAEAVEYYVQALDDQYQAQRTQTYRVKIQTQGTCVVSQGEGDSGQPRAMRVYATHKKQGRKLDEAFDPAGVTFVPLVGN